MLALRKPAWIVIGLLQPVLYLVLFGPLLEPLAATLGTTNAYTLFVPGLLVQLALFGALFVGFGLIGEMRDGVIEAERVTPASRTALLLGRVLKDTLQIFVQGSILIGLGFLFGLRGSIPGMLLGFALSLILTAAVAAAGYALALTVEDRGLAGARSANGAALPVLLLSGILLPMTIAPQWLQTVSRLHPDQAHRQRHPRSLHRRPVDADDAVGGRVDADPGGCRHLDRHANFPPPERRS